MHTFGGDSPHKYAICTPFFNQKINILNNIFILNMKALSHYANLIFYAYYLLCRLILKYSAVVEKYRSVAWKNSSSTKQRELKEFLGETVSKI